MANLFDAVPDEGAAVPADTGVPRPRSLFSAVPDVATPGVSDYAKVGIRALAEAVPSTLSSVATAIQGQAGVEAPGQEDIFEKGIRRQSQRLTEFERGVAEQFPDSEVIQTISRAPRQLGFSLAAMAPAIATGVASVPAAALPVPGAQAIPFVAGGAAGGAAAYRMSSGDIMRTYIDVLDEETRQVQGRGLTPEETEAAKADFSGKATEYGLWEALPEAIGGAVAGRLIFGPLRKITGEKIARSMLGRIGAATGVVGEELATEAVTEVGQTRTLSGTRLGEPGPPPEFTPENLLEAAKKVAPDVLLLTALLGGGAAAGAGIYRARQEAQFAQSLGIDRPTLKNRVQILLEEKAANPSLDLASPEARQFLAGAVILQGGQFAPRPAAGGAAPRTEEVATDEVPMRETGVEGQAQVPDVRQAEERDAGQVTTTDLGEGVMSLEESRELSERGKIRVVAEKIASQTPETTFTSDEIQVVANAPQAVEAELQAIKEAQGAAQTGEVGQGVQPERLGDVPGAAQEGGAADTGTEAVGRGGVRDTAQGGEEVIQEPIQPAPQVPAAPAILPRESIQEPAPQAAPGLAQEPRLAPMTIDTLPGVPPLKRGYKRVTFSLDAPGFKGDVFVEDTSTKGKKTLTIVRRTGQVVPASETMVEMVARRRKEGLERPAEMQFQPGWDAPTAEEVATVAAGVKDKNITEAADWLAENAPSDDFKLIAGKVAAALRRNQDAGVTYTFNVAEVGDQAPAPLLRGARGAFLFAPTNLLGHVWLNGASTGEKTGLSYHTVLHELIHAATTPNISLGERANTRLTRELDQVYNAVAEYLNDRFASGEELTDFETLVGSRALNVMKDTREFITAAMTLPEMQQYLEQIPFKGGGSLWSKFVRAIRTYLGLPAEADTALSEALRISEELLSSSTLVTAQRAATAGYGFGTNAAGRNEVNEAVGVRPREVLQTLASTMSSYTGRPVPDGAYTLAAPPRGQEQAYAALSEFLGKQIVFVDVATNAPMQFDGASRIVPGVLFVNAKASSPHLAVTGHEFLHELKATAPELYQEFKDAALATIPQARKTAQAQFLEDSLRIEGQTVDPALIEEELVADWFGEQFLTKSFWHKLERQNPDGFAGIVQRFLEFLTKVKDFFTGSRQADLERAQDVAAQALKRYLEKNPARIGELSPRFAAAWHGSPHSFDKFSTSAIGTGEGAQVYGWGLYFASNKEVAEWYKRKLSESDGFKMLLPLDQAQVELYKRIDSELDYYESDEFANAPYDAEANIRLFALKRLRAARSQDNLQFFNAVQAASDLGVDTAGLITSNRGALYLVELAPKEDEYLLWDKPLSEQSEKVKAALAKAWAQELGVSETTARETIDSSDELGRTVYRRMAIDRGRDLAERSGGAIRAEADDKWASEYLHSLGIRGIKYLEGASRAKGEGNYNYVVFSDEDVSITARFSRPRPEAIAAIQRTADQLRFPQQEARRGIDLAQGPDTGVAASLGPDLGSQAQARRRAVSDWHDSAGWYDEALNAGELAHEALTAIEQGADETQVTRWFLQALNNEVLADPEAKRRFADGLKTWEQNGVPKGSNREFIQNAAAMYREWVRDNEIRFSRSRTIEVDGIERPTTNSEGRPIHPTEEGIRNFWRWFGESKVVDEAAKESLRVQTQRAKERVTFDEQRLVQLAGRENSPIYTLVERSLVKDKGVLAAATRAEAATAPPRVVYHGSNRDITSFTRKAGGRALWASDAATASTYGMVLYPVYLKLVNPYRFDAGGAAWNQLTMDGSRVSTDDIAEYAEENGFDGVVISNLRDENTDDGGDTPATHYAVFSPNQIKSATGNTGAFSPETEDIRFSRPFFSKVEEIISQARQERWGSANELVNFLKGKTSEAEVAMLGLNELDGKPTKAEVLGKIQEAGTVFEDVVLGEPVAEGEVVGWKLRYKDGSGTFQFYRDREEAESDLADIDPTGERIEVVRETSGSGGAPLRAQQETHFSNYTLPGAVEGSYREMFVTAPNPKTPTNTRAYEEYDKLFAKRLGQELSAEEQTRLAELEDLLSSEQLAQRDGVSWSDGHSQYDQIKNPIVRVRYNERTGPNGERILFVEEIQGPSDANQAKMPEWARKRIYDIGVRRVLALAKAQGFDGISWTTGEQQAERYDLSKQVDSVSYDPTSQTLEAYGPRQPGGDRDVKMRQQTSPENLADYIGKEAAKKLLEAPLSSQGSVRGFRHWLNNADLKVGGEGLKNLYDSMLPKMFAKYGKESVKETIQTPKSQTDSTLVQNGGIDITPQTPDQYPMFARSLEALTEASKSRLSQIVEVAKASTRGDLAAIAGADAYLKIMPRSILVDIYGKLVPQLKTFDEALAAQTTTRNAIMDRGWLLGNSVKDAARKGTGIDAVNETISLNSVYRMTPDADWWQQEWVPLPLRVKASSEAMKAAQATWVKSGLPKVTGVANWYDAYKQGRKAFEALSAREQVEYNRLIKFYRDIQDRDYQNARRAIETLSGADKILRESMIKQLDEQFYGGVRGNYAPLMRHGEFAMSWTEDGLQHFSLFPTVFQQEAYKQRLLAHGVDPATIKESTREELPRMLSSVPHRLLEQLRTTARATAEAAALKDVDKNDQEAVDDARRRALASVETQLNALNEVYIRWLPETAAAKHALRRKAIKGFSEDHTQSLYRYAMSHAGNIAYMEHGRRIEDSIDAAYRDLRERRDKGEDVRLAGKVVNDMANRLASVKTQRTGAVASALGQLTSAWYMSSPSMMFVQLSQLPILTYPKLAVEYGAGKAGAALTDGLARAFSIKYDRDAIMETKEVQDTFDAMFTTVRASDIDTNKPWAKEKQIGDLRYTDAERNAMFRKVSDPYLRKLLVLRMATEMGLQDISMSYELSDEVRGRSQDSLVGMAYKALLLPMTLSERASRKAAILATFDLAYEKNGGDFTKAMDKVHEVVHQTLYDYAKEGKGTALMGGLANTIFKFQHFRVMTAFRLGRIVNNALRSESQDVRTAARKEFVGIMGMTAMLAGVLGTPFAILFSVLDLALGDDDEPVDSRLLFSNWLKENLGGAGEAFVARGLPAALGADVSQRVGLNQIYTTQLADAPVNAEGSDYAAWLATQILGPSFSMMQGWAQGYDDMQKGEVLRGLEGMVPKALRDVIKAGRFSTEGVKTRGGLSLLSDENIGPDEILLLALGFSPDDVAQVQQRARKTYQLSQRVTKRRTELVRDLVQALEADDADALIEAREAIAAFNRRMPAFAVRGEDVRARLRSRARGEAGIEEKRERLIRERYGL